MEECRCREEEGRGGRRRASGERARGMEGRGKEQRGEGARCGRKRRTGLKRGEAERGGGEERGERSSCRGAAIWHWHSGDLAMRLRARLETRGHPNAATRGGRHHWNADRRTRTCHCAPNMQARARTLASCEACPNSLATAPRTFAEAALPKWPHPGRTALPRQAGALTWVTPSKAPSLVGR